MESSRACRWSVLWLLVCATGSAAWCVTAAKRLGPTADESPYLLLGLERWRTGSHGPLMAVGTMPLAIDLQTLPLYLSERWRGTPHDLERNHATLLPKLLPWARAVTLVFWWALLGYGWLIARRLGGPWAGHLAVALLACEPNLLAHAALATTDIAVSACTLAFAYHFYAGRERSWVRRVGVPGVCFGLLLLAKASAVVFGPICLAVIGSVWAAGRPPAVPRPVRSLVRDVPQLLALGFVLALLYVGSDWRPSEMIPVQTHARFAPGPKTDALLAYGRLPIFGNLTEGILFQVFQNQTGTLAYLFGEVHPAPGLWYFFPLVLLIKLSLALLALPLVVAAARPRALANWAFLTALVLLVLSANYRVQDGVRYLFPLITLCAIGTAVGAARVRAAAGGVRSRLVTAAAVVAVVWMAASAALVWPDGLRYFNEGWRARPGYMYLNGSNYDWGQGLKELDRWHRLHGRPPTNVAPYGNDPAFRIMPTRYLPLEALDPLTPEERLAAVRGSYFAVSAILLYGYWDTPVIRFLRERRPVAQAGTYLIYDFTDTGTAAAGRD